MMTSAADFSDHQTKPNNVYLPLQVKFDFTLLSVLYMTS